MTEMRAGFQSINTRLDSLEKRIEDVNSSLSKRIDDNQSAMSNRIEDLKTTVYWGFTLPKDSQKAPCFNYGDEWPV